MRKKIIVNAIFHLKYGCSLCPRVQCDERGLVVVVWSLNVAWKNISKLRKTNLTWFEFGVFDPFLGFWVDGLVYKSYKGVGKEFLGLNGLKIGSWRPKKHYLDFQPSYGRNLGSQITHHLSIFFQKICCPPLWKNKK